MKAGTSGAEKAAAGNCKRICIRRPVLSGKKTVQVFLWHGPCKVFFRLTADTGRPGAEGGSLRDAFGALREYTEESGSQNTDVVDDFRNKQQ